ncbi:hypothetical protein NDK47_24215 [Brevibacillus ruminantium]|uniref:Uncharacterized protein n=1 Tax=Brevibacillus ruminantium TaxID=2950604 RepID=A0ABY4WGN4_9BACL|nr:hypothetical protein [Brevibacillus ruminantium]USG64015.1 hypothetical protein NDK47_17855 [Brevibacillus ruminantium]USG65192.1 hypothetical protein NDK47_24215 [Brevibacillus ruminantium]
MDEIKTLMTNWQRLTSECPEIHEAIKDGYEVGAYDEETGYIISMEKVGDELKVRVVMDAHFIPKK